MSHRTFQFRLHSDQLSSELPPVVERLSDTGLWEVQRPDLSTPPFRLSLIALLLCLRYHLLSEARNREIPLDELRGTLTVDVTPEWDIVKLRAAFTLLLDASAGRCGRTRADAAALLAMRQRMEGSPVARNLSPTAEQRIDISLVG